MEIRRITADDIPELMNTLKQHQIEHDQAGYYLKRLGDPDAYYTVVTKGDSIIGYMALDPIVFYADSAWCRFLRNPAVRMRKAQYLEIADSFLVETAQRFHIATFYSSVEKGTKTEKTAERLLKLLGFKELKLQRVNNFKSFRVFKREEK
jgi:hypothetical protein